MDSIFVRIQYQTGPCSRKKEHTGRFIIAIIVLPEHLFVNLIDMELQKKIANAKNMNYDAAEAIKELLEQGPSGAKKDLMDWEVEEFEEENILF
jgi:hypothetical protein